MVNVGYRKQFIKQMQKLKNTALKSQVKKQIAKIIENPEIEKPMRYERKDTREVYVSPFRLAYIYLEKDNEIIFIELYHKDEQ